MHDASPYLRPQQGPPPSQDEMFPAQTTPSATPYPPTSAITTPSTMMFSAGSVLTTPAATPYPELYNAGGLAMNTSTPLKTMHSNRRNKL